MSGSADPGLGDILKHPADQLLVYIYVTRLWFRWMKREPGNFGFCSAKLVSSCISSGLWGVLKSRGRTVR